MGLDMYAYVGKPGQREEYYDKGDWDEKTREFVSPVTKPTEIAYWRKHPNLHGWMEQLWLHKGGSNEGSNMGSNFNGIELELTFDDILKLEEDIKNNKLPSTTGFFFGEESDDYYKEHDLEFVYEAKSRLFLGQQVFYNSSW